MKHFKRKALQRGKNFYLLLFSFLSIMFLCCVLMSMQFIYSSKKSLDHTRAIYSELACKTMDSLSGNIVHFQNYASLLSSYTQEQLTALSAMDRSALLNADLTDMFDLFEQTFLFGSQIPGAIPYLYFPKSNYAFSVTDTADVLANGEITDILGLSMEDWDRLTSASSQPVTFIQQTEQMDFARLMISQEILPDVILIFAVPEGTITDQMRSHYLPENSFVVMITDNGQYLLSDQSLPEDLSVRYEDLDGNHGSRYLSYASTPYFLYYQSIDHVDTKLAVLITDNLYPQFYRSTCQTILLFFLLWLSVGGTVSYVFASKLYRPVAVLLRTLPIQEREDGKKGDLARIQSFVNALQSQTETYEEKLEKQRHLLAGSLFLRLLNRTLEWNPDVSLFLEEAGFPVHTCRFLLFQVSILPEPDFDSAELHSSVFDTYSFHHVLKRCLEEQGFSSFVISCGDSFLAFADLGDTDASPDFSKIHKLHPPEYNFAFLIGVSEIHTSLSELPIAYTEVSYTCDYMMMMNKLDVTCHYRDLRSQQTEPKNQNQFLASLQLLSNYIQSGNFGAASDEVPILFSVLSKNPSSPESLQAQLSYFVDTIQISLASVSGIDAEKLLALRQKLPLGKTMSPSELRARTLTFLSELPSCLRHDTQEHELIQRVVQYIQGHFTQSSLSASEIAEQFQVSISWLSVHFKSEMGTGFLDYLHGCRLTMAKDLLRRTKKSIRDIALETGYTNSATFSRAFSRYEGVTPSWYRKNHGES